MKKIFCCSCNADMECTLRKGSDVYRGRSGLDHKKFYQCSGCNNFVGCHPGKKNRPLGVIATPEIKNARKHIHKILDPLWQKGRISRSDLYKKIADFLGKTEYHTAELRELEECRKVYVFVRGLYKELPEHKYKIVKDCSEHIGRKCHVVGWNFKSVFILKDHNAGISTLITPKTSVEYTTKNKLTYLSGEL